ncbi:uncharacterized protein LOC131949645 [Physella acuta]|uniref:uncharacterized protein LOC131930687 n=1 Tax=Physella acuta TaxID=109671 RepID=UPI0027DC2258|nr:uncharacterized protein LOC131930687 [Physella acuta]XP_059167474.1 uncharacterized protein LOC131949645 [Physella acuta]
MSPFWVLVLLPTLAFGDALSDAKSMHSTLDRNVDKLLTKEEMLYLVKYYDDNKDNKLSMAELTKLTLKHVPKLTTQTLAWGKFVDTNKDGAISTAEFDAVFKAMDSNGNGKVDSAEYNAYVGKIASVI